MPTPTRTGYNFGGWYLEATKIKSTTQNTTIGDHTLSANWVAIPTTITTTSNDVQYLCTGITASSGSTTVTAGGGGGKWVYSIVSANSYALESDPYSSVAPDPSITLSNTGETTSAVTVTSTGIVANAYYAGSRTVARGGGPYYYIATIRATSVYNGTYAEVRIRFRWPRNTLLFFANRNYIDEDELIAP